MSLSLPVIEISSLAADHRERGATAVQIAAACRTHGFFYAADHGVDPALISRLDRLSRRFFALPLEQKLLWRMALGGRAWRGYFPAGGELTAGQPDWKEGLYLGTELPDDDPRVRAGTPLHGRNLLPTGVGLEAFDETILAYIDAVTRLGQRLLEGIALSLGLPADYFAARYTADPLVLFRIFNYPASTPEVDAPWGVGEHTDYGLLTLLLQDANGGLQVRTPRGWTEAPPLENTFVCNIG
ncbi:MAG TPA: 2-oxoglutarate and iron-dependent oxygenase domain-containing protein, partial [Nevskia sp.]|nr:2-oxoglutarate and iron-dependent oxygenase domain-containing protein [Nevskia sp.]